LITKKGRGNREQGTEETKVSEFRASVKKEKLF
jgi:hypothetical protein